MNWQKMQFLKCLRVAFEETRKLISCLPLHAPLPLVHLVSKHRTFHRQHYSFIEMPRTSENIGGPFPTIHDNKFVIDHAFQPSVDEVIKRLKGSEARSVSLTMNVSKGYSIAASSSSASCPNEAPCDPNPGSVPLQWQVSWLRWGRFEGTVQKNESL